MNGSGKFKKRFFIQAAKGKKVFALAAMALLFGVMAAGQARAEEPAAAYARTDLVSTTIGPAPNSDSSLMNPWGMARAPDGPWWVADEGSGRATLYTWEGLAFPVVAPLVVTIPGAPGGIHGSAFPTGMVYNGSGDFELAPGMPSRFIVVTRDGTITGWNGDVDRRHASLVIDNSPDAKYTGVTIAGSGNGNRLFVANFRQGRVDVFSGDFGAVLLRAGAFTDSLVPPGFSPHNAQVIGNRVYVAFAGRGPDGRSAAAGEGLGYVDAFDEDGNLILRLEQGPWMNAPWGMALAPGGFGEYVRHVLVGNSGSGRIAAFDPGTGVFKGYLADAPGTPLTVPGLHGLGFGNGGLAGTNHTLFFTAGPFNGGQNLFGAIAPGGPRPGEVMAVQSGTY